MLSAFLIVALLVVVLAAVLVRRLALQFLRTRGRRTPRTPRDLGLEGEAFALPTRDGAVRGWLMRARGTPRALILFAHGWNSNAGDIGGRAGKGADRRRRPQRSTRHHA